MRVLLVRPPRPRKAITLGEFMYCEPLGLEVVYTFIKDLCEVTLFDMMVDDRKRLEDVLADKKPEVVGFTTLCIDVEKTLRLCRDTKRFDNNIVTMVGGTQTFFNQDAFFDVHVDHVFRYTEKSNLRVLFTHIKEKTGVPIIDGVLSKIHSYKDTGIPGRNAYTHPDITCTEKYRKNYNYLGYKPCAIMQTSSGCRSKCLFCLRWRLEGGKERELPLEDIVRHIRRLPEPHVMIIDNDFFNNADRLGMFCHLLEKNRIKKNLICYASVKSVLKNEPQMERLAQNGLKTVLVGYETFSEKELSFYQKKTPMDAGLKAAAVLKKYKIDCWASFIVHPDWTTGDFKKFRRFVKNLSPEISTFSPLTPFPGLPLYDVYRDRLLLSRRDFGRWSFGEVTIRPANISLKRYYYELLKTILYINLVVNDTRYMMKNFGIKTIFRILKGSTRVLFRYVQLMVSS